MRPHFFRCQPALLLARDKTEIHAEKAHIYGAVIHAGAYSGDEPHEDNELYDQGADGRKRAVALALEYCRLSLGNGIGITEMLCLEHIYLRLHLHHLYGVLLNPDGYRQKDHLAEHSEKNYCQSIIAAEVIAQPQRPFKCFFQPFHYIRIPVIFYLRS